MATTEKAGTAVEDLRWGRWIFLIVGLLCVAAGVIVLAKPSISLATLAVVTGIFLVVDAVGEIVVALLGATDRRAFGVLTGIASAVLGILLIRHPLHGVVAVALLLGLWLIIAGAARLAWAIGEEDRRAWNVVVAAIEIIAGIVIVSSPHIGVATLALLIGVSLIVRGLALAAIGWFIERIARDPELQAHGPVAAA